MIKSSKKFEEYFRELYEANKASVFASISFEEIFANNTSRIEYVNQLFEEYYKCNLDNSGECVFRETIDYIVSFINGKEKSSSTKIPEQYYKDQSIGAIIPSIDDVNFLLKLIESTKIMFEMIYEGNKLFLKLPDESFNENMTRVLEIKKYNVAHLLGLTEYEDITKSDPSKNLLKKHFYSVVEDSDKYEGDKEAEKLLNWITSSEGKQEIIRIHNITLEFIKNDKLENPNSYDGDNLKSDSVVVSRFKERYKKKTGLDYPILNFSRLIAKSINTSNFLKLSNLVEVILDYNAPKGKSNEKDIFLVNRNSKKISDKNNRFMDMRTDLLIDFYMYANDSNNEELRKRLLNNGINVNAQNIKDQLNIIKTFEFVGGYGIEPDDSIIDEKIIEAINSSFQRDIHLIGFDTYFEEDEEIPLEKVVTHNTHCDTSIALTTPELVGHYYKYGRTFFLDKIESERGILMISNVNDEIYYLKRAQEIKRDVISELDNLIEQKRILKENYENYSNNKEKRR